MSVLASFSDPREELISKMSEDLMRAQIGSLYLSVKQYAGGLQDEGASARRMQERFLMAAEGDAKRVPVPVVDIYRRSRLAKFIAFGVTGLLIGIGIGHWLI